MAWPRIVAFMFTAQYLLKFDDYLLRDSKHHVQTQTYSDHWDSIHQTHNDKELSTQQRNQIRLARCAFQEFAPEDADTDRSTDCRQTHHHSGSHVQQIHIQVFHDSLQFVSVKT
jgi:hypothetical protein